jgi:uncharacterized protein YaiI (UPF0178 family)
VTSVRILVDADACPVKDEVYKVAWRRGVPVKVVSNMALRVPAHALIERIVVSDKFDAAEDWIADQADGRTVVRCRSRKATARGSCRRWRRR